MAASPAPPTFYNKKIYKKELKEINKNNFDNSIHEKMFIYKNNITFCIILEKST
ncbi:hypothetical protein AC17_4770 [Escherichia coli 2-210-07_S3_C2]|nr:hypothetical protein AC17_4770 [Escherichia coli 2-210-07_S3_C2]